MSGKVLGNVVKGLLFIISAPTGTGKTTLTQMLLQEFPDVVVASVSFTTRSPRENEVHGEHYYFLSDEEFENKITSDEFLEHVKLYDCYYGTSKLWVNQQLDLGKHVVLVIDTQGALILMEKVEAVFIFISPPSYTELQNRLLKRKTETKEVIEKRLSWVKHELEQSAKYDYQIVNDNLETAYDVLRSILIAEEHRMKKDNKR